jgi:predicted RNase H-like nuclease (RuvC/YqgF family)
MPDTDNKQNERLAKLETNHDNTMDYLKRIDDNIKDIKADIKCIKTETQNKIEKEKEIREKRIETLRIDNDKRYASKRTERNVDKLGWLVIAAVLIALTALVLQ